MDELDEPPLADGLLQTIMGMPALSNFDAWRLAPSVAALHKLEQLTLIERVDSGWLNVRLTNRGRDVQSLQHTINSCRQLRK